MTRRLLILAALTCLPQLAAAQTPTSQKPLVLFGDAEFPPMSWNERGVPKGRDVDVARAVARALGRDLQIQLMSWPDALRRVEQGEADGLLAIPYSAARAETYDFTTATAERDYSVFVRADDVTVQRLDDLRGRRIAVPRVGIIRNELEQHRAFTLVTRGSFVEAFARLESGDIDAVAAENWAATFIVQREGFRNVRVLQPPLMTAPISLAVRRGDPLRHQLDAAIRAITADGTLEAIDASWRPQEVVFMTREQRQRLMAISVGIALLIALTGLAIWVATLKKHIRHRQQAERARADADQRLRLALSAAEMGTWHWDAPTDQKTRDASLNRMLGLDAVETTMFRSDFLARVHPDDRAATSEALDRAVADRAPFAIEYRVVRPDRAVRWFRENGRPFYAESGEPAYATGVVVDVTAEREMAAALRRSEERFATAFQMSPDCIAIAEVGRGVVEINDRFEQITGYPRSHILGSSAMKAGLIADSKRHAEFVDILRQHGSVRDFEYELVSATGLRRTILVSGEKVEMDGRPHVLTVHRDITAHKLAEEALRRTETRYRELVENANDIIFTVDREGYCLSMNRIGQLITGYVATDARGVNLRKLVAPEELPLVLRQLQRVMAGEDVKPFEIDIISADGRRITLEIGVRPLREGASIVAAQGIARDVTTRRELEAQLRQAQKMDAIGRLAAGVAHDFNNLLTIILAHCESSAPLVAGGGPLQHAIGGIRVAADRAASLTGQLLAFSRRQVTQPRPLDLNTVVSDIKVMMSRLIGEDIAVKFRPGADLWSVSADSSQIQQVVLNLAVNARDAMPSGGDLIIETRNVSLDGQYVQHHAQVAPGDYVMISVSDSGIGMDQETLAHIFEPFFTTKEVGKGTGLGLATVYGIVKQSSGFVWVYSEVGIGSTFKVYLPRIAAARQQALPPVKKTEAASGNETVLLVEDETDLREILEHYLVGRGYTVLSAGDGAAGLAACREQSPFPRLLITDVVMPGMSGRALADQLRSEHPAMKVLYLSGYTDDAVLRHGILPNDTHFLQKPFALHDLASKVRNLLDTPQAAS